MADFNQLTLRRAICIPIPTELHRPENDTRAERLKALMRNVEKHDASVRRNIMGLGHEAKSLLDAERATSFRDHHEQEPTASVPTWGHETSQGHHQNGISNTSNAHNDSRFREIQEVADMLSTPWNRVAPKPKVKSAAALRSDTPSPPVSTPPTDLYSGVIRKTTQMMNDYDRVAAWRMRFYREAAERMKSAGFGAGRTSGPPSTKASPASGAVFALRESRYDMC